MADLKTAPGDTDPAAFLAAVEDPVRREDAQRLAALMARVSGEPAVMWGASIVGFGRYRYPAAKGRMAEMCRIGFSPRKSELVLYLLEGMDGREDLLRTLGRHRTGRSCLYIKALADVDLGVLERLVAAALATMDERHPREQGGDGAVSS